MSPLGSRPAAPRITSKPHRMRRTERCSPRAWVGSRRALNRERPPTNVARAARAQGVAPGSTLMQGPWRCEVGPRHRHLIGPRCSAASRVPSLRSAAPPPLTPPARRVCWHLSMAAKRPCLGRRGSLVRIQSPRPVFTRWFATRLQRKSGKGAIRGAFFCLGGSHRRPAETSKPPSGLVARARTGANLTPDLPADRPAPANVAGRAAA
jgi:hypothetical protein